VSLTPQGEWEAIAAGRMAADTKIRWVKAYTSELSRAKRTTELMLESMSRHQVPIESTWKLNERHYGALTGLHKSETMEKWGAERVMAMRRGKDSPPPMTPEHPMWKHIVGGNPLREAQMLAGDLPVAESLPMCRERVWKFWVECIVPDLIQALDDDFEDEENRRIFGKSLGILHLHHHHRRKRGALIVSHLHTIRLLIAEIDQLSAAELFALEVPTGIPLVYEFDRKTLESHLKESVHENSATYFDNTRYSHNPGGGNAKVYMVKGKWLGEVSLAAMPVPSIRSLLLRRRGLLHELLPQLPEAIQSLFFNTFFARRAIATAEEVAAQCQPLRSKTCVDGYFKPAALRISDLHKTIKLLFSNRPWIGVVDDRFCDACARALYAVSDDINSPPRRYYSGLNTGYHTTEEDNKDDFDDDELIVGWSATPLSEQPPRAAAAALEGLIDQHKSTIKPNQLSKPARAMSAPIPVDQVPHFARLVAVAAYLAWIDLNGAEFLPPREYSFAKDIAKKGLLSDEEILADLSHSSSGDLNSDHHSKSIMENQSSTMNASIMRPTVQTASLSSSSSTQPGDAYRRKNKTARA